MMIRMRDEDDVLTRLNPLQLNVYMILTTNNISDEGDAERGRYC